MSLSNQMSRFSVLQPRRRGSREHLHEQPHLKPSKLALHTTIQRIDAQRRDSGEAAK
jgi:hypothetical protein